MRILRLLFGLNEPVDRKTYIIVGLALAVFKYGLDFAIVYAATERVWTPIAYFSPLLFMRSDAVGPAPEMLLWGMAAYALPFAWVGLSMSVRRAANAGVTPWTGVGFLLPFINWLTIAALCVWPTRGDWDASATREVMPVDLKTAMASIGIGVALTMSMVATSVFVLKDYGWSLFIATPFVVGMVAGYLTNRSGRTTVGAAIGTALVAIVLSGLATLLFALEGIICIAMAAVPAAVVAVGGALIGRAIASSTRPKGKGGRQLLLITLLLPLLAGAESFDDRQTVYEVVTAVEVDAPPLEVWEHVIHFSELPPPPAWVQRSGVAYPIRARLEGEGVGAVRHCEFSTGAFVEPITAWEPGKRLAFDVESQPIPMKEWSPYNNIHPPHLDGYLRSKRGEFRLIELPGGRTRLEGSTWYEIDIAPASYWSLMSDSIIHRIHVQVLDHVKSEVEASR